MIGQIFMSGSHKKQIINVHVMSSLWCIWDSAVLKHPHHEEIIWQQNQYQMFGLSEDKNHLKNTVLITDISSTGKYWKVQWWTMRQMIDRAWMGHILQTQLKTFP